MAQGLIKHHISTEKDLNELVHSFLNGAPITTAFVFDSEYLYEQFFERIGVDLDDFKEKLYYYDEEKRIHIAEQIAEYNDDGESFVWVSTMGLVAITRTARNPFVSSAEGQFWILEHLLNDAIALSQNEHARDINNHAYQEIQLLTPLLFHQTTFFYELLAKAYLNLCGETFPRKHSLSLLLKRVNDCMRRHRHTDTLFHALFIPAFTQHVNHISQIPGDFKEENIKYDSNDFDMTAVLFSTEYLKGELYDLQRMMGMISSLYAYKIDKHDEHSHVFSAFYPGHYQSLIDRCDTDDEREQVRKDFSFLIDNSISPI